MHNKHRHSTAEVLPAVGLDPEAMPYGCSAQDSLHLLLLTSSLLLLLQFWKLKTAISAAAAWISPFCFVCLQQEQNSFLLCLCYLRQTESGHWTHRKWSVSHNTRFCIYIEQNRGLFGSWPTNIYIQTTTRLHLDSHAQLMQADLAYVNCLKHVSSPFVFGRVHSKY